MSCIYVECPRDSWQGLGRFIPTPEKVGYLQTLLDAGFSNLDMASFVSAKAVPQLADSEEVLAMLKVPETANLLAIVANERGVERALKAKNLSSVGYPLAVSETFQWRNTNRSVADSWPFIADMLTETKGKLRLVVYLSMAFGNPYQEPWQAKDTAFAVDKLRNLGVTAIVLADTLGSSSPELLKEVLGSISEADSLGLHLHAKPQDWQEKLAHALDFGISWFEGALAGIGGCPFAADTLLGNLPTEAVLPYLSKKLGKSLSPDLARLAVQAKALAESYA